MSWSGWLAPFVPLLVRLILLGPLSGRYPERRRK